MFLTIAVVIHQRCVLVHDSNGDSLMNKQDTSFAFANRNPLRYRGYYYDVETGFYYLQSRYYDPANHRFINADVYASTDSTNAIACNMFAYCENNPICYADPDGCIAGTIIIGIVVATCALLTGCATEEEKNWPKDCGYDYWGTGGGSSNENCYGYVFDYWQWSLPGQYAFPRERDWTPEATSVVYTRESMVHYVLSDAAVRNRQVEYLSSPKELSPDALLVACKLSSDGRDFHFAVRIPSGEWIDKPGKQESRFNKLDGFAVKWDIDGHTYDSDTIYFAYYR